MVGAFLGRKYVVSCPTGSFGSRSFRQVSLSNKGEAVGRTAKLIVAIAGLAVIAGAVVLLTSTGKATANQVRFQNAADPGPKPFTSPTDVAAASSANPSSAAAAASSSSSSSTTSSTTSNQQSPSTDTSGGLPKPGAFTSLNTHCDREKLIAELLADPAKRKAWAGVLGVDDDPQAITAYIRKLHPVTLTEDTQVTNHSFVDGDAQGFQAILPKGTPVLANDQGEPVVRCRCGNPLTKPVQLESSTRCINCPANYQPSVAIANGQECKGKCSKPDPNAPPAKKTTGPPPIPLDPKTNKPTDPVATAKTTFQDCLRLKGGLKQCQVEYSAARSLCAKTPFNTLCDSSICFQANVSALDVSSDGCGSLTEDGDIQNACSKLDAVARQTCIKQLTDLQDRCGLTPGSPECIGNPALKVFKLRRACINEPARPGCVAVQASCLGNPANPDQCQALQGACTTNPNRPDCTGLKQLQDACAKDRTKPECSSILGLSTPQVAPTLNGAQNLVGPQSTTPEQQGTTPEQQGTTPEQQGTTPENGGGQSGGGQSGGGESGGGSSGSGGSPDQNTTPKDSSGGSGQ
jgi:hypothetical protein